MSVPPGWYPDPAPSAPGTLRWWDGWRWTDHSQAGYAGPPAPSGPTTPDGEPLAGWWWRVLATVVDSILLGIVGGLATLPAQIDVQRDLADRQEQLQSDLVTNETADFGDYFGDVFDIYADHMIGLALAPMLIGLAYHAGFLRWRGATPGKLLCGLRVRLRERPGTLPWSTILVRLAAQSVGPWAILALAVVSGSTAAILLAYLLLAVWVLADPLWAAGSAKRQALHDLAARTNVVRTR